MRSGEERSDARAHNCAKAKIKRSSVQSHRFSSTPVLTVPTLRSLRRFRLRHGTKAATACTILASVALLYVGVYTQSFNFEFKGAAGLVLKPPIANEDTSSQSYSVISLGEQIPQSVQDPEDFGIRWIEVTYYLFALGMPFSCLIVMMTLFVMPLTVKSQSRLFVLAEIANAWSAMEVFVISIIAALLEIQQFAAFIIGDKCDTINALLARSAKIDALLDGDDTCFDVIATLGPDSVYLFTGAALSTTVSWGMLKMGHAALGERLGARHEGVDFVEYLHSTCFGKCLFHNVENETRHGDYVSLGNGEDDGDASLGGSLGGIGGGNDGGGGEEEEGGEDNFSGGGIYASSMPGKKKNKAGRKGGW